MLKRHVLGSKCAVPEKPLLTGEKVRKVGKAFPTFIQKAARFQITLRNRACIAFLHFLALKSHRNVTLWILQRDENFHILD